MSLKPAKQCVDVGIVVADITRSLDFYEGLLGLEKLEEVTIPFGQLHRLRFGESFVKLLVPGEKPNPSEPGLTSVAGFRYITFSINNLDEACVHCEKAGAEFYLTRREIMPGIFIAMLKDPDGNIVELVERS